MAAVEQKRRNDGEGEDHMAERKCPIHCQESRTNNKEEIESMKAMRETDMDKLYSAIGKKVPWMVVVPLATILFALISYLAVRDNDNFKEHTAMASQTQVEQVENRINKRIDKMEENLTYEIRDLKGNGKGK